MSKRTELEDELERQLILARIPYEREYKAIEGRRFRWDFAFPSLRLLAEVQGGIWIKGGHSTGTGITRDCEKLNLATTNNWYCMSFTGDMVKSGQALGWIQEFIDANRQ